MDISGLHDTVLSATGKELDKGELLKVFASLPDHIRGQARLHGCDDSVVRDSIYSHLRDNGLSTEKVIYKVEGKEREDEGRCHLTLRFGSLTDMMSFVTMAREFDNDKLGVREMDALDKKAGGCKSNRRFMAAEFDDGGNRLTVIKQEVEVV